MIHFKHLISSAIFAFPLVQLNAVTCVNNSPPNIIVVFTDDLGYGDLSCYGHPTIKTPHIDKMAAEGMKFNSFYTASSICTPSRGSLLTGRLPVRTGIYGDKMPVFFPYHTTGFPGSEITVAEGLKTKGYATACIGKWHLGSLPEFMPNNHGFDYYFGIPYSNDMLPVVKEKQTNYPEIPLYRNTEIIEQDPEQQFLTKRFTDEAIGFIEKNMGTPFFIYLAHIFPHTPLHASGQFEGKSARGLYGDVVEELDYYLGKLLNYLRDNNLAENTLVIFTSDNGSWLTEGVDGGSAGLLKGGKWSTWEGGMRVPAIFWWPNTIKPGSVSLSIASTMDIYVTSFALAGVSLPSDRIVDGHDLSPILKGETQSVTDLFFYYRDSKLYAVRKGAWKAHFITKMGFVKDGGPFEHEPPLLYNLNHDPSEQFDLAEKHPEIIEEIRLETARHKAGLIVVPSIIDN